MATKAELEQARRDLAASTLTLPQFLEAIRTKKNYAYKTTPWYRALMAVADPKAELDRLLALQIAQLEQQPEPVPVPPQPAPPTGAMPRGIGYLRLGSGEPPAAHGNEYDTLIVGHEYARQVAALPGRSLVYLYGLGPAKTYFDGIDYQTCQTNGWVLKDAAGAEVVNQATPWRVLAKFADPAYQAEWARGTIAYLKGLGVDGCFIDDMIAQPGNLGPYPAAYPNQAAWENAVVAFLAGVGPKLEMAGFYVAANAYKYADGDKAAAISAFWRRVGASVSGLLHENYITQEGPSGTDGLRRTGAEWWNQWDGHNGLIRVAEDMSVDFLGLAYGPKDARRQRYVRGSFLLERRRPGSTLFWQDETRDPWTAELAFQIGAPAGAPVLVGGKWRQTGPLGSVTVDSVAADAVFVAT
jgi:hypothetical protein